MRQPLFCQPSQVRQLELAALQLEANSIFVLQGLPLMGKRALLARLSLANHYSIRYFSVDAVSQAVRPKHAPAWLGKVGEPRPGVAQLSLVEDVQFLPDPALAPRVKELVRGATDRLILVSTREVASLLPGASFLTLTAPTCEEAAVAARLQGGADLPLTEADWLALARQLGGIPGLLAFACKQLRDLPLEAALEAIRRHTRQWKGSVCDPLPATAETCRLLLSDHRLPMKEEDLATFLNQASCLSGLSPLQRSFLLERNGAWLSLLTPVRENAQRPYTPPISNDALGRQCRRLWQLACEGADCSFVADAEGELLGGHWSEALRLYGEAQRKGQADGYWGWVLTQLLLGRVDEVELAIQQKDLWTPSQRYPQPAVMALAAYCRAEFALAWEHLRELSPPWDWMVHCLSALLHEAQGEFTLGQQCLSQFRAQSRLQQAWRLWVEGRLWLVAQAGLEAESCWVEALRIFAEEGHPHGLALVQTERLAVSSPSLQGGLDSWADLVTQLGNTGLSGRLRDLRGAGVHPLASPFTQAWLKSRPSSMQPKNNPEFPLLLLCLGPLRLKGPAGECLESEWPTRKAATLFYLLCQSGQPVSDESLMALLWPSANLHQARTRLRTALHHVRLVLSKVGISEGIVRSRKTRTIALSHPCETEVQLLRNITERVKSSTPQDSCAQAWEFLERHRERIFLPTFRDDWTDSIRFEVNTLWCDFFRFLGRNEIALQRPHLADQAARLGLELEEFREDFVEMRLRALRLQGLESEAALWAASDCHSYLEEFGQVPEVLKPYLPCDSPPER
jgi:hypothetical protein